MRNSTVPARRPYRTNSRICNGYFSKSKVWLPFEAIARPLEPVWGECVAYFAVTVIMISVPPPAFAVYTIIIWLVPLVHIWVF